MTEKEDLYKFLEVIYKDNEALKTRLAWLPDGVVLETVGSRFFYMFSGAIRKVLWENNALKEQNKRLTEVLRDISICVHKVDLSKKGDELE